MALGTICSSSTSVKPSTTFLAATVLQPARVHGIPISCVFRVRVPETLLPSLAGCAFASGPGTLGYAARLAFRRSGVDK